MITALIWKSLLQVWTTFTHNWPFLVVSVVIAVGLKLFLDPNKVSAFLMRYRRAGVFGATVAAVTTPLCSCGTTAVVLGMLASTIPWAPIIAFMVASPLTSPQELVYSAGLFGWPFALVFFGSSVVLGLLGGLVGEILERRGWLKNQARFGQSAPQPARAPAAVTAAPVTFPAHGSVARSAVLAVSPVGELPASQSAGLAVSCACDSAPARALPARPSLIASRPRPVMVAAAQSPAAPACACEGPATVVGSAPAGFPATAGILTPAVPAPAASCACSTPAQPAACACSDAEAAPARPAVTWKLALDEALTTGRRLLVMFFGFAFIGYFLNGLIPAAWVSALFGQGNVYSVPLAATLGLPLYINSEASLPLVRALIDGGMSQGAAMAFLITGAGTSIGAVAGAFTIARWRVVAAVVGTLWVGAIAMGFLVDFLRAAGLL